MASDSKMFCVFMFMDFFKAIDTVDCLGKKQLVHSSMDGQHRVPLESVSSAPGQKPSQASCGVGSSLLKTVDQRPSLSPQSDGPKSPCPYPASCQSYNFQSNKIQSFSTDSVRSGPDHPPTNTIVKTHSFEYL